MVFLGTYPLVITIPGIFDTLHTVSMLLLIPTELVRSILWPMGGPISSVSSKSTPITP